MGGGLAAAEAMAAEPAVRLPRQRKTRRGRLALPVATMPEARSAKAMDPAARRPRAVDRLDRR